LREPIFGALKFIEEITFYRSTPLIHW
jgi:hypothetical protein